MKLDVYPLSMTSRPLRLFIHENGIDCEEQVHRVGQGARRAMASNPQ